MLHLNPLVTYRWRAVSWTDLRDGLLKGLLVGLILMILAALDYTDYTFMSLRTMLALLGLILAGCPLVLGLNTIASTVQELRHPSYQLLTTTSISDTRLVIGHCVNGIYNCRGYLMFCAGLLPVQVVAICAYVVWGVYYSCSGLLPSAVCTPPDTALVIATFGAGVLMALLFVGFNAGVVILSVVLVILVRSSWLANIILLIPLLLGTVCFVALVLTTNTRHFNAHDILQSYALPVCILAGVGMFGGALLSIYATRHRARIYL